nr:TetR/AcrR family transcriptional regulator [Acidimicrobiia bacterium]
MDETLPGRGVRQRVRQELTAEIKDVARRHLAEHRAEGLSLRAVAREMGMVSSALYRYFGSRDELLTALIVDAYDALGATAEVAEAAVRKRSDLMTRWLALATATRVWAVGHPHEWSLIFGSPVPGYRAPADTVDP